MKLKFENFMSSFGRRSKRNVLKMNACRIWSTFNQSCHWFVVLLLPQTFLASRIVSSGVVSQSKEKWIRAEQWRENLGPTAMYFWKILLLLKLVLTLLMILTDTGFWDNYNLLFIIIFPNTNDSCLLCHWHYYNCLFCYHHRY